MDARQCCPEYILSELHERAGSLPLSTRPEASKQHRCSANITIESGVYFRMSSN